MAHTMTRRAALAGSAGALLASWLLPRGNRAGIDLERFCHDRSFRYDLTLPFRQAGRVYATDGFVAARVTHPGWVELAGEAARLPDMADVFDWRAFDRGGWRPAADLRRVKRRDRFGVTCPTCRGAGRVGAGVRICSECERDDVGFCDDWLADPATHSATGYRGGEACPECAGASCVRYALTLDGVHEFAPQYVADLLTLPGGEFRIYTRPDCGRSVCNEFLLCRFDGGEALLASLA